MAEKHISAKIKSYFSAAANRQNLTSGEEIQTSFGKIAKWLSDLKTVAFTGSYNDLSNKPTIPTVNNGTLTIQKNGTNVATFTANQSGNSTANIATTDELSLTGAVEGSGTLNNGTISAVTNRKSCCIGNGGGSAITNSWFLAAQVDVAQNSYVYKATFYVELGIDTTLSNVGILEIVVRKTSGALQYMKAKWIVAGSGININDFALSYDSTSHLCSLYINRPAAYSVYRLTSIAESERGGAGDKADVWTLYNTSTGIASLPSGTGITTVYSELPDTQAGTSTNTNRINVKSSNIDRDGNNPSAMTSGSEIRFTDVNNLSIGGVYPQQETSGAMRSILYSRSGSVYNTIAAITDKDGTQRYLVSNPANFRAAIGAVAQSQLNTSETSDTTPYIYKSSEHDAVYDELVGGSVAWNQLIGASWDSLNKTEGTTFTQNSDGTLHISGTGSGLHFCNSEIEGGLVNGHKYWYSMAGMKAGITSQIYSTTSGSARYIVTSTTNSDGIFTYTAQASDISQFARFYTDTSYSGTTDLKYILIDLTQMFGSTIADYVYNLEQSTAGSGIAWLKSYGFFTKDYYAYNAGGLVSVNTSGKKVVGKNLLKIITESTTINGVTFIVDKLAGTVTVNGTNTTNSNIFFNLDFGGNMYAEAVKPSTKYTAYAGAYNSNCALYVGAVRTGSPYYQATTVNTTSYKVFTTQADATRLRDYIMVSPNATVNNMVFRPMIVEGEIEVPFEPYTSITYPIQSTDLRGLYKLNGNKLYTDGDIYSADGTVTRKYGIVDLGSLDWQLTSGVFTPTTDIGAKVQSIQGTLANILCPKYVTIQQNQISGKDKVIFGLNWGTGVGIIDSSYTDAATFKTAMSGVYLIYELATPTIETTQPFASPQMVYRNGIEEYLDTRDVQIPVGGNRKYVDIPEWMVNEYFDDVRALKNCLPLSGGTMTGDIVWQNDGAGIQYSTSSDSLLIWGGITPTGELDISSQGNVTIEAGFAGTSETTNSITETANNINLYTDELTLCKKGEDNFRFKVVPNSLQQSQQTTVIEAVNDDYGTYGIVKNIYLSGLDIIFSSKGQSSTGEVGRIGVGRINERAVIQGGIGSDSYSYSLFRFYDNGIGDSIGKLASGSPLTGSEFNLNYETINLKGSTINIDDNMSMAFETVDDYTVNTINSPYMVINTDGISLLPKTLSYFSLLISGLSSGAGSELVVNSNGMVYKSSSSRDIKHDIKYVENTESYHDALMQIKPATYVYNNDTSETTKLGMIAEDIADVMPIAALTGESDKVENYDTRAIIAMLVMEVQRLNAEIERLRGDSNAD